MSAPLRAIKISSLFLVLAGLAARLEAQTFPSSAVLTNAEQIREMTPAQTALAVPASVTGVVLDMADPVGQAAIISDHSAGIYVLGPTNSFATFHRGDLVEAKGVTDPGQFAPIIRASTIRKLGTAAIPEAQPVTYQQMITGALDGQWVELRGVVRQCFDPESGSDIWRIIMATDGGLVPVRLSMPKDPRIQIDAEICIQAVCLYQFNQERQVLSPILQIPRDVPVQVAKLQPADPYAMPLRSSASLLQFSPKVQYGHRVHVRGVVTFSQPGSLVWIRDASSGLRIQTGQKCDLQTGDEIDVLGFPSYRSAIPLLENAVYRKIDRTNPPVPLQLTNLSAVYDHQDDLVTSEAKLMAIQTVLKDVSFTLDKEGKVFKAVYQLPADTIAHPDWQVGSLVRITGICSFVYDESKPLAGIWKPQSFQILLRSPADLAVLRPPPWWTPRHIIFLLGGVVIVSLLATGWALILSRQQERRRKMAENEFAAILAERNRLSREIHDTLAQGLGAISMQLELVKSQLPPDASSASKPLEQAHQLVRSNLADARNTIWNMRSQVLETGNLASALTGILQQLSDNTGVEGRMRVIGRLRRLPPVTENNLLRIGQEAITNAMKHAQAGLIEVELQFADKEVRLCVKDNGRGFDTTQPPASASGFGLMGMRERGEELHAELTVRSTLSRGTEVTLVAPVAG